MTMHSADKDIEYDSDGLPVCPHCGRGLSCEDSNGRDTETMGGCAVDYYVCDNGCGHFEVIDGTICPSD